MNNSAEYVHAVLVGAQQVFALPAGFDHDLDLVTQNRSLALHLAHHGGVADADGAFRVGQLDFILAVVPVHPLHNRAMRHHIAGPSRRDQSVVEISAPRIMGSDQLSEDCRYEQEHQQHRDREQRQPANFRDPMTDPGEGAGAYCCFRDGTGWSRRCGDSHVSFSTVGHCVCRYQCGFLPCALAYV